MKLYTTDNEGTGIIKCGLWIESPSLHKLNLLIELNDVLNLIRAQNKFRIKIKIISIEQHI